MQLIPTLFGLSLLLFIWLHRLPGGPETGLLGERGTPELRAQIRRSMGLDQPLWVQYWRFLKRLLSGDLGNSIVTKRPVWTEFVHLFPATIELTIVALVIAVGAGIPLGYFAARRRGSWLDNASVSGAIFG